MKPTNDSQKEVEQDPFPHFVGPYVRIIELQTFIGQVDTTHLLVVHAVDCRYLDFNSPGIVCRNNAVIYAHINFLYWNSFMYEWNAYEAVLL